MKVTIITVARNAASTLGATIASVAAQDHQAIEHIIVDGASSDGTLEIIKANARKNLRWISEVDAGIYDAMNKGIRIATGDLIGFLNADDYFCRRDAVSLLVKAASDHPEADAIAAAVAMVNKRGRVRRYYRAMGFASWMLKFGHMPPHPGFYARRSAFAKIGNFDAQLKVGGDFEWIVRFFRKHGLTAHYIANTVVTFRLGGASSDGVRSLMAVNKEAIKSCQRHGLSTNVLFMLSKYIVKVSQYFVRPQDLSPCLAEYWSPYVAQTTRHR